MAISHKRQPRRALPGRSTVGDISRRHGLVPTKRPPRRMGQPGQPTSQVLAPTDGWRAEFNGQVTTGDGPDCSPLPGADGDSRSLRGGQALSPARVADATPVLTRLFKAFGWPKRLRTDNGVPFATAALGRLSPLPAWWGRRGRFPEGIGPGTPQPTGRPERRPRPRQAGPPRPPARTRRAPQLRLERCRAACNRQRPHEALATHPPAACDAPAPRQLPHRWPPLDSPDRVEGRDVSAHAGLRGNHHWGNGPPTCMGEEGGLEASDAGLWNVDGGPLTLGRRLERRLRIEEACGRRTRRRSCAPCRRTTL